jgi:hypothetical protein
VGLVPIKMPPTKLTFPSGFSHLSFFSFLSLFILSKAREFIEIEK